MQTYKIYINESCLYITDISTPINERVLRLQYHGKIKLFFQLIDRMEKATEPGEDIQMVCADPKSVFSEFKSLFTREKAAGGIIRNESGEVLFIFRRGHWDLPKGKMDPGEKNIDTAYREIEEEVGLSAIEAVAKAGKTWHTYRDKKNRRVLKRTSWFVFDQIKKEAIQLEAKEDIEAYHWIAPDLFLKSGLPTYRSIRSLMTDYEEGMSATQ